MNTPVSFELAKLLKEKKFGLGKKDYIKLPRWYDDTGEYFENKVQLSRKFSSSSNHLGADTIEDFKASLGMLDNSLDNIYLAPTIAEVVMWLYEKHEFWITVKQGFGWEYFIYETNVPYTEIDADGTFNSPTEAYEAAIEYILKNLL